MQQLGYRSFTIIGEGDKYYVQGHSHMLFDHYCSAIYYVDGLWIKFHKELIADLTTFADTTGAHTFLTKCIKNLIEEVKERLRKEELSFMEKAKFI